MENNMEMVMVISNPTEDKFLERIEWNKEEFETKIKAIAGEYENLVYTEETIKDAKKDRATLNSLKKQISDRRIQVKKQIMKPYEIFEAEVKEVLELIEIPTKKIDKQIKEYEERVKNEKKEAIEKYFKSIIAGVEFLSFEDVFEKSYLNATASIKSIHEDIDKKVEKVKKDIESIHSMEEEVREVAKDMYIRTRDMSAVMNEISNIKKIVESSKQEQEEVKATEKEQVVQEPKENDKIYKSSFTVYGTKEQIMALKKFMENNNIKFGKVEK